MASRWQKRRGQSPSHPTLEQEPSFIQGSCLECSSSWLSTQLAHLQPLDLSPNVTYTKRCSPSSLCIPPVSVSVTSSGIEIAALRETEFGSAIIFAATVRVPPV